MAEKYHVLRKVMQHKGVEGRDIARWIDRSEVYVSHRMTGASPWSQSEMYTIMQKLHIPLHKLHIVFPQGGMWAGPLEDPPPTAAQKVLAALEEYIKETAC